MKKLLSTLLLSLTILSALAVPAKRIKHTLQLADGSTIEAFLVGDEHGRWYQTADGAAYSLHNDGYAVKLSSTELSVMKQNREAKLLQANVKRSARMAQAVRHQASDISDTEYIGSKKGIVILVNFADLKIKAANTQEVFNDRFNKVGYTDSRGAIGSVHDYFYDQSYGKFDLSFDVVGPVTVSKSYSYYGKNSGGGDVHPCEMVIEAINLADEMVDYSDYDWNGDGTVEQVFIIYAGYGENAGASSNTIWPHEWELAGGEQFSDGTGAQTLDGVTINTYAVSCELSGTYGSTIDGIGTACHEFSHCLGYPDVYDTAGSSPGMLAWDLLDAGAYNGPSGPGISNGEVPAAYTSYERWQAGWVKPVVLERPRKIEDMKALVDEPEAYIIYNDAHKDEYYLLENRQQKSWDKYQGGHGLFVMHVDYDKQAWISNTVNNNSRRQRMTFIPADNSFGTGYGMSLEYAGDPFPGSKKKTELTDTSTPAATLYNTSALGTKFMGKPITEIAEIDGKISFIFMGGLDLETPEIEESEVLTPNSFTATWTAVEGAESYSIELKQVKEISPEEALVLKEDCANFKGNSSNQDQGIDISGNLDQYTSVKGWTGAFIYSGPSRMKLSSTRNTGYLITPLIDCPESGSVTLKMDLSAYGNDNKSMIISLVNESGDTFKRKDITLPAEQETIIESFNGITTNFKVRLDPGRRAYVYGIEVYNELFEADDFNTDAAQGKALAEENDGETIEPILIEGITENTYTFEELPSAVYRYRVKAVSAEGETPWSDYASVDLTGPVDGIECIKAISTEGVDGNTKVFYNTKGQRVVPSAPGLYIHNRRVVILK